MTRAKQTPQLKTRITAGDVQKFDQICRLHGKTKTEMVRVAILELLEKEERSLNSTYESLLEKRMRKMEDRLAALTAKNAVYTQTVLNLMYRNMDPKDRQKNYDWAVSGAVRTVRKKPTGDMATLIDEVMSDDFDSRQA